MSRRFTSPHHPTPRTHLLSNGSYSVMLTAAGSGFSRWRDLAVTRWREDITCDPDFREPYLQIVHNYLPDISEGIALRRLSRLRKQKRLPRLHRTKPTSN